MNDIVPTDEALVPPKRLADAKMDAEASNEMAFEALYNRNSFSVLTEYVKAYNALKDEFSLAAAMIQARAHAGLTQEQLAERMHTTQAVIARLESGRVKPSTRTLERLAAATGMRLRISFEPSPAS